MTRFQAGLTAAGLGLALLLAAAGDWYTALPPTALAKATYVGGQTCAECHQLQHDSWLGSHHDRAMELASDASVLGDFDDASFERLGVITRFFRRDGKFFVNTEGPDGEFHDYEIAYTFGIEPLQQYMVKFPQGRVQVLRVSWDTQRERWFEVTPPDVPDERLLPSDPLHWTGVAQNWNTTCAECHSTNLQKKYDVATDTYNTTYSEIDVSCEECHGPGSVHVDLARGWSLFWDRHVGYGLPNLRGFDNTVQIDTCAKCHSRRHAIRDGFRPGRPFLDYYEPSLLEAGLYHANGQILDEVYEYGSFLQSKMFAERVRCSDCHNPHSLELRFTGNRLCTQCHAPGRYDTPLHHHHVADSPGSQCIECHMPERTYMVIDERRDHSFRVPRPDLSVSLGTPNACNDCHAKPGETAEWAATAVRDWYGPPQRADAPVWAVALAAGNQGAPIGEALLADVIRHPATPAIVRATAASLTGQYASAENVAVQQAALRDLSPLVRMAAVNVLSGISMEQLVADLSGALDDSNLSVRTEAARRLAALPREQLAPAYRGALDRALDEYRAVQQLQADRAHGHVNLGALARQLGDQQQAADELRLAIRMAPYLSGPRSELVAVLNAEGGHDDEIRQLRTEEAELRQRDTELLPNNAEAFYQLGLLRYLLGEHAAAAKALAEACRLAPGNYEYRMMSALLDERRYETGGDERFYDAAVASLELLQRMRPEDSRAGSIRQRLEATRASKAAAAPGR
jgi:predicted CXXCH cytochrome family protein